MLKKPRHVTQTRLRDASGSIVDTDARAETFAQHLEKLHWYVRPVILVPGTDEQLYELPNLDVGTFTLAELRAGVRKLKSGRAPRVGDIPAKYLKALAAEDGSEL